MNFGLVLNVIRLNVGYASNSTFETVAAETTSNQPTTTFQTSVATTYHLTQMSTSAMQTTTGMVFALYFRLHLFTN